MIIFLKSFNNLSGIIETLFAFLRSPNGNHAHEEKTIFKLTLAAAALASVFAAPVFAEDAMMKCDDASMMKMQSEMDAMTDPAMKDKKEMASKEMMMAKDSMTANKMDDCKMHMDNAMKSIGKM
ncbi:hypothetical protein [Rhizobium sp. PL01]|uniref:hypothetical protein n=1 Tax=Rhizobium sp. PL01 TaxID=3085631 RepID=UPI00298223A8|nr:hypothetical protein [Rhizobium sp. PL01]MDW5318474.1 hypothetical protein [Rhizobium sp. PL01]